MSVFRKRTRLWNLMYGMYPMCTQYRIVVSFTFKYAASSGVFQRIASGRACAFRDNLPGGGLSSCL